MGMIKGPGLFLAQFTGDDAPFNGLGSIVEWAADLGYKGVQIPSWDGRLFDLAKAAESDAYCDEVKGICADAGVEITELSSHLQGQLVAVHPAFDEGFDAFAPPKVHKQSDGAAGLGCGADEAGRQGLAQARPRQSRFLHRSPCLALHLPLAAASLQA